MRQHESISPCIWHSARPHTARALLFLTAFLAFPPQVLKGGAGTVSRLYLLNKAAVETVLGPSSPQSHVPAWKSRAEYDAFNAPTPGRRISDLRGGEKQGFWASATRY